MNSFEDEFGDRENQIKKKKERMQERKHICQYFILLISPHSRDMLKVH